jgi:hypothetical protein
MHQKYKTKSDNTGIAALRKDGELTDNTTEKANIINSQFQKAFSGETTSEPIPVKGKSNYLKMKNITQSPKSCHLVLLLANQMFLMYFQ